MRLIKGYANRFDTYITEDGHVFIDKPGNVLQELQQEDSITGYHRIRLASRPIFVHRLVATAYLDKPDGCNVVNHLDEDKTNNDASNLEWTTQSGNMKHYFKDRGCKYKGSDSANAKLNDWQVKEIVLRLKAGDTVAQITRDLTVSRTTISNIKLGKSYMEAAKRASGLDT